MSHDEATENWRAHVGELQDVTSPDILRAREPGRGRQAETPEQIPARGWLDIFWRVFWAFSANRIMSTSGGVAFFALLAIFPGIGAVVSLYGLFADASTIGEHMAFLSGILPFGVLEIISEQIKTVAQQQNDTLGAAFIISVGIAIFSANSGMAALFDALNVVYDEREKRHVLQLYLTTFLFTLAGIAFVILALIGLVVLPLVLEFIGLIDSDRDIHFSTAMACTSPNCRGEPCFPLSLRPKPPRCTMALGILG